MSLFQMSIAGGALIFFLLIIRAFTIHYLPKTTFWMLWVIIALRLLLPFSLPLPFFQPHSFSSLSEPLFFPSASTVTPVSNMEYRSIFFGLWLAGVVLLGLFFSLSYLRSMQIFHMSIPDETPYIKDWLSAQQTIRTVQVRTSDFISSPLTYGILRPVILLPKHMDRSNFPVLQYVLTHEWIHIQRFDAVIKLLFAAALCIHWFNPLVWVMYVLANRDMELSCDAWVIHKMGEKNRSFYALMLLELEEKRPHISTLCNHFSKHTMTERIEAIMKFKKTTAIPCALALVLVVGAMTTFATSMDDTRQSEPKDPSSIALIGVAYDGADWESIDLTQTDDPNCEIQIVDRGENVGNSVIIDMEDAQSEDLSNSPVDVISKETTLISVSHDDESKFTPEEWSDILKQIEQGTVYWED